MKCMKYKGIKLKETMPKQWDGKTREMLVWTAHHNKPLIRNVIGYNPVLNRWVTVEDSNGWPFCAEIPMIEQDETTPFEDALLTRIEELKEEISDLKEENKRLKNELNERINNELRKIIQKEMDLVYEERYL